jgi:signal transduction histidine kinase
MSLPDSLSGAGILVDDEDTIVDGNIRCEVVFERDVEEMRGTTLATLADRGVFDDETDQAVTEAVDAVRTEETGERTVQITIRPRGTGDRYRYDMQVTPAEEGVSCELRSVGTAGNYEETLTALHAATRELMTAEDVEAVLRKTAVAASAVLGFPGTGVRRHDPDAGLLHHVGFGADQANIDSRPPYAVEDSPHGRAIRRGETVIDDIDQDDDPFDRSVFSQTMYIPIGEFGLLSIGTIGNTITEKDVQLAEILAENAAAAITVVDTTASLRRERERLEQFASVLSHDLRNPLGIARTYLDFAESSHDEDDFAAVREALNRMDTMIDDLLTIARTEETVSNPEPTDLSQLVEDTWRQVETDSATLSVDLPDGWCVRCDSDLLRHVFENLFRNAVEHNDTPVTVTVGQSEEGFYVADDGDGIPPDVGTDIFEYGVITNEGGIGLGLSIVAEIVEAHGWTVSVTAGTHGGARFEIDTGEHAVSDE